MVAGNVEYRVGAEIRAYQRNSHEFSPTDNMKTLEDVGVVSYEVEDPWLQEKVTYAGVLLADLMELAGAPESTAEVFAVALDGYAIGIPVAEIESWPVLIATRSDGAYMTIENSGPTRIIFPYERHDDIIDARNYSVWNLESLDFR